MKKPPLIIKHKALPLYQSCSDNDPTPQETVTLYPVTVTRTQQQTANRVTTNPKYALKPIPARDGAHLLQ
ncbi:TonB-dependent copper receptor, partial [Neisseria sp. P0014.S008]